MSPRIGTLPWHMAISIEYIAWCTINNRVLNFSVQHLCTVLLIIWYCHEKTCNRRESSYKCPDFVLSNLSVLWASIYSSHANTSKKGVVICCSSNHIQVRCIQESLILPFAVDIKLLLDQWQPPLFSYSARSLIQWLVLYLYASYTIKCTRRVVTIHRSYT